MSIYCYLEGSNILRPRFLKFTVTTSSNVVQISLASALLLKARYEIEREKIVFGDKCMFLNPIRNVRVSVVDNPKEPNFKKDLEIESIYINCKLRPYENLIPEYLLKDFIKIRVKYGNALETKD